MSFQFARSLVVKLIPFGMLALSACGGRDGSASQIASVPDAPGFFGVKLAEQTVDLSWQMPSSDGGAPVRTYIVTIVSIAPSVGVVATAVTDRTDIAMEVELQQGTQYSLSVAAQNTVGTGQPASVTITLGSPASADYTPLVVEDNAIASAVSDPTTLRLRDGQIWIAYSSANYDGQTSSSKLAQDVGIRLARSDDAGKSFKFTSTVAVPEPARVTDTDPQMSACGAPICNGRWVYKNAWLAEDATDSDPSRRFKLFAQKYLLLPATSSAPVLYHLGAIVMWTAPALDGEWSGPTPVLGSILTPPELTPSNTLNTLHPDLSSCLSVAESGLRARDSALELVLSCVYPDDLSSLSLQQKVVLLRTTDHAQTFEYVSSLLSQADAGLTIRTAEADLIRQ